MHSHFSGNGWQNKKPILQDRKRAKHCLPLTLESWFGLEGLTKPLSKPHGWPRVRLMCVSLEEELILLENNVDCQTAMGAENATQRSKMEKSKKQSLFTQVTRNQLYKNIKSSTLLEEQTRSDRRGHAFQNKFGGNKAIFSAPELFSLNNSMLLQQLLDCTLEAFTSNEKEIHQLMIYSSHRGNTGSQRNQEGQSLQVRPELCSAPHYPCHPTWPPS